MKLQYNTVKYNIEEAVAYLEKLIKKAKNKTLTEEEFIPEMEHVFYHLNFSINARYLNQEQVSKLSQAKYEKYILPPMEITGLSHKR